MEDFITTNLIFDVGDVLADNVPIEGQDLVSPFGTSNLYLSEEGRMPCS